MEFVKYHGLGNDFVFVEDFSQDLVQKAPMIAKEVCDRNFGVGADGLVLITKVQGLFTMRIFNADGSEADMCGNAIRCLAKHLLDNSLVSGKKLTVGTLRSTKEILVEDGEYSVNMGQPIWEHSEIPVQGVDGEVPGFSIDLGAGPVRVGAVSMGNPHAVVCVPSLADVPLTVFGPRIEKDHHFPAKTNVEFVEIVDRRHVKVKVWERGVGPTLACGTGACASVAVCARLGKTDRDVVVSLPGGDLKISWTSDSIWMTGPATRVFTGTYLGRI